MIFCHFQVIPPFGFGGETYLRKLVYSVEVIIAFSDACGRQQIGPGEQKVLHSVFRLEFTLRTAGIGHNIT
jgi:hypothetical protein